MIKNTKNYKVLLKKMRIRQGLFIATALAFFLFPSLLFASREEAMAEALKNLESGLSSKEAGKESISIGKITSLDKEQTAYDIERYQEAKEKLGEGGSMIKKKASTPSASQPRIGGQAFSPKAKTVESRGVASRDIQDYYAYALEKYQKSKGGLEKESLFQDKKEDYLTQEEKEIRGLVLPKAERMQVIEKALGELEFALAIGIGYLAGDTRYEINFVESGVTGKSELIFPFDDWLGGGNILLGYYPLYVNFQGWTNITKRTNSGMTDKDWADGVLFSSTESNNEAQIRILDANLLYNFWQGDRPWGDVDNEFKKGRFGLLVGYRYENFKYDIIGYRNVFTDISYYPGQRVLDYEVTYRIPYLGLNLQYINDIVDKVLDSWGLNLQACGSPYVKAKDKDYHLLRNKLSEGDTKGYAFLFGLNVFLKTKTNWIWRLGFDYTDIGTKGKQNQYWYGDDPNTIGDDTGTRIDGIDLRIGSVQYLFWGFLQYNF